MCTGSGIHVGRSIANKGSVDINISSSRSGIDHQRRLSSGCCRGGSGWCISRRLCKLTHIPVHVAIHEGCDGCSLRNGDVFTVDEKQKRCSREKHKGCCNHGGCHGSNMASTLALFGRPQSNFLVVCKPGIRDAHVEFSSASHALFMLGFGNRTNGCRTFRKHGYVLHFDIFQNFKGNFLTHLCIGRRNGLRESKFDRSSVQQSIGCRCAGGCCRGIWGSGCRLWWRLCRRCWGLAKQRRRKKQAKGQGDKVSHGGTIARQRWACNWKTYCGEDCPRLRPVVR